MKPSDRSLTALEIKDPPCFKFHVFICQNERPPESPLGSCAAKGSGALLEHMKALVKDLGLPNIRINKAGCLGQCQKGPVLVVYPEGRWFQVKTQEDVDRILTSLKQA